MPARAHVDLSGLTPVEAAVVITEHEPGRPSAAVKRTTDSETNAHALTLSKAAWADLDVLCLTAMHKDPSRRYRTVEALIRDVDHYLNGEPLEARPERVAVQDRQVCPAESTRGRCDRRDSRSDRGGGHLLHSAAGESTRCCVV